MAFGKRQSGVGATAQAFDAEMPAARGQVAAEPAHEATGFPFRSLLGALACGAGLYFLFVSYAPDLVRDHRLSGTWQPAYDLRAVDGKCERRNFVITFCNAKIKSVAKPELAPAELRFMMLFSSGGGEILVPVRSTVDRAAVSVFYAADTKLWNRTLSFLSSMVILALLGAIAMALFWRGVNS